VIEPKSLNPVRLCTKGLRTHRILGYRSAREFDT